MTIKLQHQSENTCVENPAVIHYCCVVVLSGIEPTPFDVSRLNFNLLCNLISYLLRHSK